ncbi:MAG: hypothetical protein WA954_02100 [Parerythrobacter sp.]
MSSLLNRATARVRSIFFGSVQVAEKDPAFAAQIELMDIVRDLHDNGAATTVRDLCAKSSLAQPAALRALGSLEAAGRICIRAQIPIRLVRWWC